MFLNGYSSTIPTVFFIPGSGIVIIRFVRAAVQAQGNKVGKATILIWNKVTVLGSI